MTKDDLPSDTAVPNGEAPIPAILLPPKQGSAVPRVRVRHTNWKGIWGIVAAVVVAPNLAVLAATLTGGAPFAVVLSVALATPLVAVVAGIHMAYDIRRGAESSKNLAVAAIVVGMAMTVLMVVSLVLFSSVAA